MSFSVSISGAPVEGSTVTAVLSAPATTFSGTGWLLCDMDGTTLTQLYPTSANVQVRLNRPMSMTLTMASDDASLIALAGDGDPRLVVGTRTIKYFRNSVLRGHCIVWNLEYTGDENTATVQITAYDPMMLLRFRPVRDETGNLINPAFTSPIAGALILETAIDASVYYEGALPIDYISGTFDDLSPPAPDMAAELTDWPIMMGDLITLLTDTGDVDVVMDPVQTSGYIGQLSVVTQYGSDLSGTVHFDYGTGNHAAAKVRRTFDMDSLCNKLYYYLGPKQTDQRWAGNITATETTPVDLSAWLALETASRAKYGTFMRISVYDSANENTVRPLFYNLWETEVELSVKPRELLYITPVASDACPFQPFDDYNIGDLVGVNADSLIGPAIVGGVQRVYGFDVSYDQDGVERVGEFIASADAE